MDIKYFSYREYYKNALYFKQAYSHPYDDDTPIAVVSYNKVWYYNDNGLPEKEPSPAPAVIHLKRDAAKYLFTVRDDIFIASHRIRHCDTSLTISYKLTHDNNWFAWVEFPETRTKISRYGLIRYIEAMNQAHDFIDSMFEDNIYDDLLS